jgi:hypothetical protein
MKIKTIILFLFLINIFYAQNNLFRYISLEDAVILSDHRLMEGGKIYPTAIGGNAQDPLIFNDAYAGNKSLLFSVPSGQTTQRFEYKLCDYDQSDALKFDNERFVGFAIKIPDVFDQLEASLIFFQAWQGSPWGPPIMLKVTSGSNPYLVRLTIRNISTGPNSENADEKLWSSYMYKNRWYTFVIGMKPRIYGDSSHIQLWLDNQKVVNWSGNIGYDPSAFTTDKPLPNLCLKFGIYKPGINLTHSLTFDEIRLTDNYNGAVPVKTTAILNHEEQVPSTIFLYQNYPNPFNSTTSISFDLPAPNYVRLRVFNVLGKYVKVLINKNMESGKHEVKWQVPEDITTGVYFYRIETDKYSITKKLLLIK